MSEVSFIAPAKRAFISAVYYKRNNKFTDPNLTGNERGVNLPLLDAFVRRKKEKTKRTSAKTVSLPLSEHAARSLASSSHTEWHLKKDTLARLEIAFAGGM